MFLHPSNMLFLFMMFLSILTIISTHSLLMVWAALEVNMMVFIPLIINKNNKYQSESALKYFLIQSMASTMILMSMLYFSTKTNPSMIIIMSALMMKVASAPFHQWLPSMVNGLSWKSITLLLIPQKLAPLIILINNSMNFIIENMMLVIIIMSAMVGSISGLIQSTLRKIMAYSSITHMSWILSAMLYSKLMCMFYFMLYSITLILIIYSFMMTNSNHLKNIYNNNMLMMTLFMTLTLLSLAGLPPFSGFFPKLLIILVMCKTYFKLMLIPLTLSTLISLYFYLRIAMTAIIFSCSKNSIKKYYFNNTFFMLINIMISIISPLMFIMLLNFKLSLNYKPSKLKKSNILSLENNNKS